MLDQDLIETSEELEALRVKAENSEIDQNFQNRVNRRLSFLNQIIDEMPSSRSQDDEHVVQIAYEYYRLKDRFTDNIALHP